MERARRRQKDLKDRGCELPLEQIQTEIEKRDANDRQRRVGPLKAADDAVIVETTDLNIEQVIVKLMEQVKIKCPNKI